METEHQNQFMIITIIPSPKLLTRILPLSSLQPIYHQQCVCHHCLINILPPTHWRHYHTIIAATNTINAFAATAPPPLLELL